MSNIATDWYQFSPEKTASQSRDTVKISSIYQIAFVVAP